MNLSSPAEINRLMRAHGIFAKRRFGQNFLADSNVLAKIVDAGRLSEGSSVLEVGAGLGVLTCALAGAVGPRGRVVSYEVDRSLVPALAETVGGLPQVSLLLEDALDADLEAVRADKFGGASGVTVVANIPYNITTPLLGKMLEHRDWLSRIVFLVQKEVAARLAARPGTDEYGALSVFAQYHAAVEIVATVSKRVFVPPPDVESAIVRLELKQEREYPDMDEALFFKVVRAAFGQRRKSLLNALSGDPALGWTREQAAAALQAAEIDPGRRGETLSIEEFVRLTGYG